MGVDAKDILPMVPAMMSGLKLLTQQLGDQHVDAGVQFGEDVISFIVDAKAKGLTPEMIVERVYEMTADLNEKLKFGA